MHNLPDFSKPPYADYQSPEPHPGVFSRAFPTALFYARVSRTVFHSAYLAKKGLYNDFEWWQASARVRQAFEKTGARISLTGSEHFAKLDGPCIFIGNHMSTAETFLLPSFIQPLKPVTFVVKQSLVDYPVFKHIMRSRDPVVVGRVNPRDDLKAVLNGGRERLDRGVSIVIFPQRTRSVQFARDTFSTIGVKLASRAGVPVIPLALKTNAWKNGRYLKDFGRFDPRQDVKFEFGPPIDAAGDERAAHHAVIAFVEERLRAWGL